MNKNTRKIVGIVLMFLISFFTCLDIYRAEPNGTSSNAEDSGSSQGAQNRGVCTGNAGTICSPHTTQRIMVSLIYYDGKGKTETLAGKSLVKPKVNGANPSDIDADFNWFKFEPNGRNSWKWEYYSDNFEKDTVGNNKLSKEERRQQLKKFIGLMARRDPGKGWEKYINLDNLDKDSCEVNRKGNCYGKPGYRIVAELHVGVVSKNSKKISDVNYQSVKSGSFNWASYTNNGFGKTGSTAMRLAWSDINYSCKGGGTGVCNNADNDYDFKCLKNKNCSYGVWIVDITSALDSYDYSLDAACVNCNSKNSDSKAAVIQDTTNWKAITNSTTALKTVCPNVSGYFEKDKGVFCREEYHIYYPNANNKIKVETGRFFTVNETKEHLDLIDGSIPNFAPIRVKKIRQCKGENLNTFKAKSDTEFKKCGGTINLKYDEGTYKLNKNLVSKLESFSSETNDGMLQQEATFTYTLPLDTYRYVRIQDGYSLKERPADFDSGLYKDLNVSNLPLSFSSVENNPKISFKYALPNASTSCGDVYSSISKAYTSSNDYLTCSSKAENVYVKETADDKLSDSACAKLFNSTTSDSFISCKNEPKRKTNKMGNCYSAISGDKSEDDNYSCDIIIDKCDKDTAGSGKYKDQVWNEESGKCVTKCSKNGDNYIGPDGKKTSKDEYENKCCTKETHESIGRDWNENEGKCCEPGTIYDKTLEVCVGSGKPTVCAINNYKSIGRDWNDNEGICCPADYKYYSDTKRCEPERKTKCDTDHLNCEVCCEDKSGRPYCGIVLSGVQVCPGAGKPEVSTYRNIDVTNPFLSQTGTVRTTGDNWCNNSVDGSKTSFTCSGDPTQNSLIKAAVTDKSNVSEDDAMYKVELNSSDITAIRNYNKKHEYDDFDLSCKSDGTACKSEFLSSVVNTTGKCADVSKESFYKCGAN